VGAAPFAVARGRPVRFVQVGVVWVKFLLFFFFIGLSSWLNINADREQAVFARFSVENGARTQAEAVQTIDINRADAKMLEALPGIGPKLSAGIIQYRRQHGDYRNLSDLMRVRGIGPKKAEQIKPYIHFSITPSNVSKDRSISNG